MPRKIIVDPNTFTHPGLTDSQAQPVEFRATSTAWGGYILYPPHEAVFTGVAYKGFLAWLVLR